MTVMSQPETKSDPFYRVTISAPSPQLELLSDLLLRDPLFRAQLDDAISKAIVQAVRERTGRLETYVIGLDIVPCIKDSRRRVLTSREKRQKMHSPLERKRERQKGKRKWLKADVCKHWTRH